MTKKRGFQGTQGEQAEPTYGRRRPGAHLKAGREARTTATVAASILESCWVSKDGAEQLGTAEHGPGKRGVHNGSAPKSNNWLRIGVIVALQGRRPGP